MTTDPEQVSWPVSRGLFAQFSGWLRGRRRDRARLAKAFTLYHAIVARARQPRFYAEWGVPDTADGRLEMIGLHAALVIRRLKREGDPGKVLAQDVFDVMFADVDRNLREGGVGDLSVGKHVKRAAQTFLARCQALDPALDAGDAEAIARILDRNIYNRAAGAATTQQEPLPPGMLALAAHVLDEEERLLAAPAGELLAGRCDFVPPDGEAGHSSPGSAGRA